MPGLTDDELAEIERRWKVNSPLIGGHAINNDWWRPQDVESLFAELRAVREQRDGLVTACGPALAHVIELREAWMRGAISERDGKGGTRSNRNVDVEVALRAALAAFQPTIKEPDHAVD